MPRQIEQTRLIPYRHVRLVSAQLLAKPMSNPIAYVYEPIIAAGFIPHYDDFVSQSSLQGFKDYLQARGRRGRGFGCKLLFKTGNIPDVLESNFSVADVDHLLKSRNYRGLLLVKGIKAHCSSGQIHDADCDPLICRKKAVGFTPYRNPWSLSRYVWKYSPGTGYYDDPPIDKKRITGGYQLGVKLAFRVGLAGRFGGRVTIGHWPAHVWIRLGLIFQNNGDCTIYLSSSGIPDQHYLILAAGLPACKILDGPLEMNNLEEKDVRNALECDESEMPEFYTKSWKISGTPIY